MRLFSLLLVLCLATTAFSAEEKKVEKKSAPAQMEEETQTEPTEQGGGYGQAPQPYTDKELTGCSANTELSYMGSGEPQPCTTRPADEVIGGNYKPEQPNEGSQGQTPASTSTMSTDELLNMNPSDVANIDKTKKSALLTSIDAAIQKWEAFGNRGGVGSGVLDKLKKLRESLMKKEETEEAPQPDVNETTSAGPTEPTTQTSSGSAPPAPQPDEENPAPEDETEESEEQSEPEKKNGRDTHPPQCNFSVETTESGSENNRVTINSINFFDAKDPKTNIASGVTKIRFSNDGNSWQEFSVHKDEILWTTGQPDEEGYVTIYMQAGDKDGNWGNGSQKTFEKRIKLR